jgi:tetratricopeptide (TPR) repeat protein
MNKERIKYLSISTGLAVFLLWATAQLCVIALADIYDSIGRQKLESKEYESAESYFARSVRLAGSDPDRQMHYAESLYVLAGRTSNGEGVLPLLQRTMQAYRKAAQLNPREGNAWLGLAQTYWWMSKFSGQENKGKEVESFFQRALATDPNNGKFLYALVDYYLSMSKPDQSTNYVTRLACVYPDAWGNLRSHPAWSGVVQGRFIEGLKIAASNRLTNCSALAILAGMAAEAKDWDQAATWMEQLIRQTGGRGPIACGYYLNLGWYLLKSGHPAEAKSAFLLGLRESENRNETLNNLLSRFGESKALDLYLELAGNTASFDAGVLSSLFLTGDLEAAEGYFQQALQTRETAAPHRYLAEIAMKRKDWDKAELESHRAATLDPRDSYLHYLLARSLEEQKRYMAALEAIGLAIQYAQRPNEYYYDMQGRLFWSINDHPAAIQAWESARQLAPKNAGYTREIAQAYKMLKDYAAAERYYLVALGLDPGNGDIAKELQAVRAKMSEK